MLAPMTQVIAAAISVAILLAAVGAVLWAMLAAAAVWGVFWLSRRLWLEYRARTDARVHDPAELLACAEIQLRWSMSGDPRGTFGRYPAAAV